MLRSHLLPSSGKKACLTQSTPCMPSISPLLQCPTHEELFSSGLIILPNRQLSGLHSTPPLSRPFGALNQLSSCRPISIKLNLAFSDLIHPPQLICSGVLLGSLSSPCFLEMIINSMIHERLYKSLVH